MIRAARPADAGAIARLATQLGYPSTEEEAGDRLANLLTRGDHAIFVHELAGKVTGWVAVRSEMSLEGGRYAEIVGLVVDEPHRGRGIGEDLVQAGESWAVARGHRRMRVRSNVLRERAHRFYERLGYALAKRQAVLDKELDVTS